MTVNLTAQEEETVRDVAEALESGTISETSLKQILRYREQCLLASSLKDIVDKYGKEYKKPWRYVDSFSTKPDGGSTADFLNKLHRTENITALLYNPDKDFMNIKPGQSNKLGANIEITKVKYQGTKDDASGVITWNHQVDIPIKAEQMAKDDMEIYNSTTATADYIDGDGVYSTRFESRPDTAYGIKSFEWSYVGENPETVRNDIEATLVLSFQNFNQLVRVYSYKDPKVKGIPKSWPYSWLDLLGYGPESLKYEGEMPANGYDPAMVEIKVTVDHNTNSNELDENLKAMVKHQKQTLFLTLIDHEFNIGQTAPFTLTLTYRARLEGSMGQMKSNVVFSPDLDEYAELVEHDKDILGSRKEGCPNEHTKDLISERPEKLRKAWKKSFTNLLDAELSNVYFTDAGRNLNHKPQSTKATSGENYDEQSGDLQIFVAKYEKTEIVDWYADPAGNPRPEPDLSRQSNRLATQAAAGRISTEEEDTSFLSRNDFQYGETYHEVPFLLLGDILEIMAYRAFSKQNFLSTQLTAGSFGGADKIKIISGPVRLSVGDDVVTCSLSDIPIAFNAFADFWYKNVIQNEREVYSILDFIRDLGDQLLDKSLGSDCAIGAPSVIKGKTQLNTGFISLAPKSNGEDPLLNISGTSPYDEKTGDIIIDNLKSPLVNPSSLASAKAEDVRHYIVLYMKNSDDLDPFGGVQKDDAERGVHHITIHQGPYRSINFSKTDQPYLRETRYALLADNPLRALSNVYKISCTLTGNSIFYPGQTVFINPIGFGARLASPTDKNSISNVMGLGGYHVITSVQHSWGRGGWTTTLGATWTHNGKNTVQEIPNAVTCEASGKSKVGGI